MESQRKRNGEGEVLKSLLGGNVKRFRINSGFTMEELAEKAGISVPFLGAIERGEKWPSPTTLAGIGLGLGVNPYDLLKPETMASQDINKITTKLIKDISIIVNQSAKMMNTVVKENHKAEK
ncbi:MAG: helix-turn-helix domain-containing protein [Treponema sp.]|nr:helix-turn-helix domain-containing protein [Treponema sp.]